MRLVADHFANGSLGPAVVCDRGSARALARHCFVCPPSCPSPCDDSDSPWRAACVRFSVRSGPLHGANKKQRHRDICPRTAVGPIGTVLSERKVSQQKEPGPPFRQQISRCGLWTWASGTVVVLAIAAGLARYSSVVAFDVESPVLPVRDFLAGEIGHPPLLVEYRSRDRGTVDVECDYPVALQVLVLEQLPVRLVVEVVPVPLAPGLAATGDVRSTTSVRGLIVVLVAAVFQLFFRDREFVLVPFVVQAMVAFQEVLRLVI